MDRICYIYVFNYRILHNVEIVIDPHYKYDYTPSNNTLMISEQGVLPEGFWGKNIYSLTGIFGNNASGKSSTLSLLLSAIVDGIDENTYNDLDALIVYRIDDSFVYSLKPGREIQTAYRRLAYGNAVRIPCFYYSGHFSPYNTLNDDPRYVEYAGSYIASDSWRLVDDIEEHLNIESHSLTNSMKMHVESYWTQNTFRICSLLADERLMNSFNSFSFPKLIVLKLNTSGWKAVELLNKQSPTVYDRIPKLLLHTKDHRQSFFTQLVYYNLANYLHDYIDHQRLICDIINKWQSQTNDRADVTTSFLTFTRRLKKSYGTIGQDLHTIALAIRKIEKTFTYDENHRLFYLDVSNKKKLTVLKDEIIGCKLFLTGRLVDLEFRYDLGTGVSSSMSSGEQELLNFFSRLYYAVIVRPDKFANVESSALLMLDEAENSFHPKWQRKYILLIKDFCNTIAEEYNHSFQIIITSHSPLLLSDVPKCCGNYLKRTGDTIMNMRNSIPESFCQNVFKQYKNSFFLDDGLIGDFALQTIHDTIKKINDTRFETARKIIELISDPVINGFLTEALIKKEYNDPEKRKQKLKEYYIKKAEEL